MYFLVKNSQDNYFYCTNDTNWSTWHLTVKGALAAKKFHNLSRDDTVIKLLKERPSYILLCKSKTPITIEDNPELLI